MLTGFTSNATRDQHMTINEKDEDPKRCDEMIVVGSSSLPTPILAEPQKLGILPEHCGEADKG